MHNVPTTISATVHEADEVLASRYPCRREPAPGRVPIGSAVRPLSAATAAAAPGPAAAAAASTSTPEPPLVPAAPPRVGRRQVRESADAQAGEHTDDQAHILHKNMRNGRSSGHTDTR